MPFPFEVPFEEVERNLDGYIDAVFDALQSDFLTLPRGPGFVEYPVFAEGYEALKVATEGFRDLKPENVRRAILQIPIGFIVLRTILGFTPPEWAYVTSERTGAPVSQGFIRNFDREIRMDPLAPRSFSEAAEENIQALVATACELIQEGVPEIPESLLHRLDKADTKNGLASIQSMADLGVPYSMVLYERLLGRPFASHRDSVSELVGDVLETAVEDVLSRARVTYRKTKRAERVAGFDQAPDFIVPDEFNPRVVIEAKVTEDDGTARDKVTRVQHLRTLSTKGLAPSEPPRFEVIACIAGRGFKVRREDMKKLLLATSGKVFALQNVNRLIECSRLREFAPR